MLKVTVITQENDSQFWTQTFEDVWEGPVKINLQKNIDIKQDTDLIILDFSGANGGGCDILNAVASSLVGKHFLLVSDVKDADVAIEGIRLGAIGFLVKPFKRHELLSSLDRLHSAPSTNINVRSSAKLIALTSYKGGTGVSTTAVNLAYSLSHVHEKKTLLIDAAGFSNHVSVLLNLIPKCTIADLSRQGDSLDENYLSNAVNVVGKNLYVISGLMKTSDVNDVNPQSIEKLLAVASDVYDFIIVDVSTHLLDEVSMLFLQRASDILLLTTFEILAIRDNRFFINTLKEIGILEHKIKPVINRQDWYIGSLEPDLIQKQINHSIFHSLPNDWELCVEASNYGRPTFEVSPNAPLPTAYNILASKFTKSDIPVKTTESNDATNQEEKKKKKGILWF